MGNIAIKNFGKELSYENEFSSSQTTLNTIKGWNLLSNPTTTPISVDTTFTDIKSIFTYKDNTWDTNPKTITNSIGFWLNSTKDISINLTGKTYKLNLDSSNSMEISQTFFHPFHFLPSTHFTNCLPPISLFAFHFLKV